MKKRTRQSMSQFRMRAIAFVVILGIAMASIAEIPTKVFAANESENGRVFFNGHSYQLFNEQMNWNSAKQYCENLGGHLVTITSEQEQNFLENLIKSGTKEGYWIGATDEKTEGVYEWITGEVFSYTAWRYDQPDNNFGDDSVNGEDYLHLWTEGKWNDNIIDGSWVSMGFICEWEDENNSKQQFIDAHLAFIHDHYDKYMSKSLQTLIIGNEDMESVKKVNSFWNFLAANWFDNPYDVFLTDYILSNNTQTALENVYEQSKDDAAYEVVKDLLALLNEEGILGDNTDMADVKMKIEEMFETDDFSDKATFELVGKILKNADQDTIQQVFSIFKKFSLIVDTAGDVSDVAQKFVELRHQYAVLQAYTTSSQYLKSMLEALKIQCDQGNIDGSSFDAKKMSKSINRFLTLTEDNYIERVSALALKNYGKCAWTLLGDTLVVDNVKVFLKKGLSAKLSDAALSKASNYILAAKIGYSVGKGFANEYTNMDALTSAFNSFYIAAGMSEYMKPVVENAKNELLQNPSYENAVKFCEYWQLYQQNQVRIADYGIQYYTAIDSAWIVRDLHLYNHSHLADSSFLLLKKRDWLSYDCPRIEETNQHTGNVKLITVACPVNVTITDEKGNSVLIIKDDNITQQSDLAQAVVIDGIKYIAIDSDYIYHVNVAASENGKMDYYVTDINSNYDIKSTTAYSGISLIKGTQYIGQLRQSTNTPQKDYVLMQNGEVVSSAATNVTSDNFVDIETITIDKTQLTIKSGDKVKLVTSIFPDNATSKTVTWQSSNEDIVTVDEYGNVKAISGGDAYIYCYSVFGKVMTSVSVSVTGSICYGDANGDGKVNGKDATRLMQYLAGWDVEIDQSAADVNGDSKVNGKDATRLMQYLAGWDVTLG